MEVALAERFLPRMVRPHVRDVRLVVRYAHDAAEHGSHAPRDAGGVADAFGISDAYSVVRLRRRAIGHGLALLPFGPMVRSYKSKMRVYSSVQLDGRTNPWSSTG